MVIRRSERFPQLSLGILTGYYCEHRHRLAEQRLMCSNLIEIDFSWGKNTWKAMSPGGDECIKIMDNAVQSQRIMLTQIASRLLELSLIHI